MMDTRVAIFDLDGTLIDSTFQIFSAMNTARNKMTLPNVTLDFIAQNLGLPVTGLIPDENLHEDEYAQLIRLFREELLHLIEQSNTVYQGAISFLDELLLRGWRIGIATSKPQKLAEAVIKNSELQDRVSFIQGTDGFLPKPNPEVVQRCLSFFQTNDAIMFGDRMEDMAAAKSAGIHSVGILHSTHNQLQLKSEGASFVIKNWADGRKNLNRILNI